MRNHKWLGIVITIALICCIAISISACAIKLPDPDETPGDGNTQTPGESNPPSTGEDNSDIGENSIGMRVKADSDNIGIELSALEQDIKGTVDIIEVKSNEYLAADKITGVSDNIVTDYLSKKIGEYVVGENKTISIERFVDGYDRLYNKYYAVQGEKIIAGPVYATDIKAEKNVDPQFIIKSKKGVLGEDYEIYKDLNCSYTVLNFEIASLFCPTEKYENGVSTPLDVPENAIPFESNGKTYYFNPAVVTAWDNSVKQYYGESKSHITAVVWAVNHTGLSGDNFPLDMTYMPWSAQDTKLLAFNTSNEVGLGYYTAFMEFLASRYSDPASGLYVENFIIGNEIDYSGEYFRISEEKAPFDTYMEEYSRLLRISNLAMKKYNSRITVNASFTHAWAKEGTSGGSGFSYAPKEMIEWLNKKSKLEGDYDWGIAPHCYGNGLGQQNVFNNDTKEPSMTNDVDTTAFLTFSNIELIEVFLNREDMLFNGNTRSVWLTEAGISSKGDKHESTQAGIIAASWYKISQLDSIKAFAYYRMIDHAAEGGMTFGLMASLDKKKLSYDVWKYIDTQYSPLFADRTYLEGCMYVDRSGVQHSVASGHIKSYMDVLDPFETGWVEKQNGFDWQKAMPVTITATPELEGQMFIQGIRFSADDNDFVYSPIRFDSRSFIYDGEKHVLALSEPVGNDVTVRYTEFIKGGDPSEIEVEEPAASEIGSKTYFAIFEKDGIQIGKLQATITIGHVATDKGVYSAGADVISYINVGELQVGDSVVIFLDGKPGKIRYKYDVTETTEPGIVTIHWSDYIGKDNPDGMFIAGTYKVRIDNNGVRGSTLFSFVVQPV